METRQVHQDTGALTAVDNLYTRGASTMSDDTFTSRGTQHKITIYPAPADGKTHAMILVLHGNAGLNAPFGSQIQSYAKSFAELGYLVAVPQYYHDDLPHLDDGNPLPHVATLSDAIAKVAASSNVDPKRLGLIGYSLGAATAMTYIASNAAGTVKVLVDFFGPIEGNPIIASGVAQFPPTIMLHNKKDEVVRSLPNSGALDRLLPSAIERSLYLYDGGMPEYGFHPFVANDPDDVDSRKRATQWVLKHLPPTASVA
jgi:dienelactone hydrolase